MTSATGASALMLFGLITGLLGVVLAVGTGWVIADGRRPDDRLLISAGLAFALSATAALLAVAVLQVDAAESMRAAIEQLPR